MLSPGAVAFGVLWQDDDTDESVSFNGDTDDGVTAGCAVPASWVGLSADSPQLVAVAARLRQMLMRADADVAPAARVRTVRFPDDYCAAFLAGVLT